MAAFATTRFLAVKVTAAFTASRCLAVIEAFATSAARLETVININRLYPPTSAAGAGTIGSGEGSIRLAVE